MLSGRTSETSSRSTPLIGVGLAAVPAAYDQHRDRRMAEGGLRSKPSRDPHSLYLQLLAEARSRWACALSARAACRPGAQPPTHLSRPRHESFSLFAGLSAATQSTLELKDFWLGLGLALILASQRSE